MPDKGDDYIEIDLDDADEVLDVVLQETPPPGRPDGISSQPRSASASSPRETTDSGMIPMLSGGVCPRCGFALRPLEEQCPKCRHNLSTPVEKYVDNLEEPSKGPLPAVTDEAFPAVSNPKRGCNPFAIAGTILFLTLVIGLPAYLWTQPGQRARREYRAGLAAQLRGEFEVAREHYRAALGFDPNMGLAAFSLGTTYLHIGDPALTRSIQEITQRAVQGETKELDEADRWFEQAAKIGQQLPPATRLMDQRIKDPPRLRAFAHACMALTALIRASAAIQADQLEHGMQWFAVATEKAQQALLDDPSNSTASQILGAIPTPGTGTSPGGEVE